MIILAVLATAVVLSIAKAPGPTAVAVSYGLSIAVPWQDRRSDRRADVSFRSIRGQENAWSAFSRDVVAGAPTRSSSKSIRKQRSSRQIASASVAELTSQLEALRRSGTSSWSAVRISISCGAISLISARWMALRRLRTSSAFGASSRVWRRLSAGSARRIT